MSYCFRFVLCFVGVFQRLHIDLTLERERCTIVSLAGSMFRLQLYFLCSVFVFFLFSNVGGLGVVHPALGLALRLLGAPVGRKRNKSRTTLLFAALFDTMDTCSCRNLSFACCRIDAVVVHIKPPITGKAIAAFFEAGQDQGFGFSFVNLSFRN